MQCHGMVAMCGRPCVGLAEHLYNMNWMQLAYKSPAECQTSLKFVMKYYLTNLVMAGDSATCACSSEMLVATSLHQVSQYCPGLRKSYQGNQLPCAGPLCELQSLSCLKCAKPKYVYIY